MALSPRLDLRTSQTLVMTPQLQQAIKLLQLTNMELQDYLSTELEKNPLLEMADEGPPVEGEAEPAVAAPDDGPLTSTDAALADDADYAGDGPLDAAYENSYDHDGPTERVESAGGGDSLGQVSSLYGNGSFEDDGMESSLSSRLSLRDHLTQQLPEIVTDAQDRLIAAYMIDLVDDSGYLTESVAAVAERLGTDPRQVEIVLAQLQTMDPAGVFARDLAECLSLQQAERDRLDPAMQALLQNLDLLARRDYNALRRICGVDAEDLTDMIAEIRSLNPKPGLAFGGDPIEPVVPDVYVRKASDGSWAIELNNDTLPRVLINNLYYARVAKTAKNREEKNYINECLNSANWLVKALDQRARTILKVATELVRQQESFFTHGVRFLKPLNLRAIAEAIEMHESTVSRVTTNKYIATSRGIFEMKYFFTSAIGSSDGGEDYSAESVRDRIRELIDREEPNAILSDDKLVDILREEGIEIARRTVAKYREAMRISSSVDRRRAKSVPA